MRPVSCEGQQHGEHRARGADDGRVRREGDGQEGAGDAPGEVQGEELPPPQARLDPRPEEEEPEHVPQEMEEVPVEELVGDERPRLGKHRPGHEDEWIGELRSGAAREEHYDVREEQSGHPGCHWGERYEPDDR